jgi:hypothetical protein
MTNQIITGVFTLMGVVVGLLGERWVRTWGEVQCKIDWWSTRGAGGLDSPGGVQVQERQLRVTFLNRKDVPVTVWDMRVVFYRGDKALNEKERPHTEFADAEVGRRSLDLVNLPPRIPVTRTITVTPGRDEPDKQQAVEEADRVEFVAIIEGTGDIRMKLASWKDLTPYHTATEHRPWWRRFVGG